MENKKVYVVVGVCGENTIAYLLSKYGVKSTLKKAQEELKIIKREILDTYMGNIDDLKIIEKEKSLEIYFDEENFERYFIEERIIDIK